MIAVNKTMTMSKKRGRAVLGAVAGLAVLTALGEWPSQAALIQMALYTSFVLVPLFLGLWPGRHRDRFWPGIAAAVALHFVFLYSIRAMFPFSTILTMIPIALIEFTILVVLMLKLLGDSTESRM